MHRPHLLSVLALASAACSAPAAPRPVVPPPRVEAAPADAAVVAVDAVTVDAALPPVDASSRAPRPPRRPGAFDWQRIRDKYARVLAAPIGSVECDYRVPSMTSAGKPIDCYLGGAPDQLAAKVVSIGVTDHGDCGIVFDIGEDAQISRFWFAALLDADDVPMTAWVHVQVRNRRRALIEVPCDFQTAREREHVALVGDLRWR